MSVFRDGEPEWPRCHSPPLYDRWDDDYGDPWNRELDRYEPGPVHWDSHIAMCLIIGCAAGAVLSFVPLFGLFRHRQELIELGTAVGGLVGLCRQASRRGGPDR